jgi:serine/threonine protein kinase
VLLYELLTGTPPLNRKRLREAVLDQILRLIREEGPPKPSTRLSETGEQRAAISARRKTEPAKLARLLRGGLDWIVMRCLEKDRTRRYDTANGLARDVHGSALARFGAGLLQQGRPAEAEPALRECLAIREKKQSEGARTRPTASWSRPTSALKKGPDLWTK